MKTGEVVNIKPQLLVSPIQALITKQSILPWSLCEGRSEYVAIPNISSFVLRLMRLIWNTTSKMQSSIKLINECFQPPLRQYQELDALSLSPHYYTPLHYYIKRLSSDHFSPVVLTLETSGIHSIVHIAALHSQTHSPSPLPCIASLHSLHNTCRQLVRMLSSPTSRNMSLCLEEKLTNLMRRFSPWFNVTMFLCRAKIPKTVTLK